MTERQGRALELLTAAAVSCLVTGLGFHLTESRMHVHRDEFNAHLDAMAPIVRQIDESRGAVTARLGAIDYRLAELAELIADLRRSR